MRPIVWIAVIIIASLVQVPSVRAELPASERFADEFWQHWGDGKAELDGYELSFDRYGERRDGVAVTIFVTETFSRSARVKADPGRHPDRDLFPVMKLNLIEDFGTGIYDYNLMTSCFVALTEQGGLARGSSTKITHGTQEWCGQAFIEMLVDLDHVDYQLHSYFDGEGDQSQRLKRPAGAVSEDALLLWARELAGPFLELGESVRRPLLVSARSLRMHHSAPRFETARFSRDEATENLSVPAGSFEVEHRSVQIEGGARWDFWVERAAPHRLIQWEKEGVERARLLGSDRLAYWKLNGTGGEEYLQRLGLQRRPPRTP